MPLIDCEIELELSWSNNSVISKRSKAPAVGGNPPNTATKATETLIATFQKTSLNIMLP